MSAEGGKMPESVAARPKLPRPSLAALASRLIRPRSRVGDPAETDVSQSIIGALFFAGILWFIASSIDAPVVRIVAGVDPRSASWLARFSQIGTPDWLIASAAAVCALASVLSFTARRVRTRAGFATLALRAAFLALTVAASVALVQALKFGLGRAQPSLMNELGAFHFEAFSHSSAIASFLSGHATTAFAAATVLAFFVPRIQLAFFVLALGVALARIATGAHYPSDALGGMVLGMMLAIAMARFCARRRLVFQLVDGRLVRRGEGLVRRALGSVFATAPAPKLVRID